MKFDAPEFRQICVANPDWALIVVGLLRIRDNCRADLPRSSWKLTVVVSKEAMEPVSKFIFSVAPSIGVFERVDRFAPPGDIKKPQIVIVDDEIGVDSVVVDLSNGTTRNFDNLNMLQRAALDFLKKGDFDVFVRLISWYVECDFELDPDFAFAAYAGGFMEIPLKPDYLESGFIKRFATYDFPEENASRIRLKLIEMIDGQLNSSSGHDIIRAFASINEFIEAYGALPELKTSTRQRLIRLLFLSGRKSFLSRIVDASNVGSVVALFSPSEMGPKDLFLESLSTVSDFKVWEALTKHYFSYIAPELLSVVLDAVDDSCLTSTDKERMISVIVPINGSHSNLSALVDWYRFDMRRIVSLPGPISEICRFSKLESFSRLVDANIPDDVAALVRSWILDYFENRLNESCEAAAIEVVEMMNSMTVKVFDKLDLTQLFERWFELSVNDMKPRYASLIASMKPKGLRIPDALLFKMNVWQCLLTLKIPSIVDVEVLKLALIKSNFDAAYFRKLVRKWIASSPTVEMTRDLAASANLSDVGPATIILEEIWSSDLKTVNSQRRAHVDALFDASVLTKMQRKTIANSLADAKLAAAVRNYDSLLHTIIRRFRH